VYAGLGQEPSFAEGGFRPDLGATRTDCLSLRNAIVRSGGGHHGALPTLDENSQRSRTETLDVQRQGRIEFGGWMIFSDGECPACGTTQLRLNTSDLLECPQCHLVCACIDGVVAAVMPHKGQGNFRFEDCDMVPLAGVAIAKALPNSMQADTTAIFASRSDLQAYVNQLPAPANSPSEGATLLEEFLCAFRVTILETAPERLLDAWSSSTARTAFYTDDLMPEVARRLKLQHGREEFKVDFVMVKQGMRGHVVPKVYIESENNYADAGHEMRKLCSMNAPLRMLVTATAKPITSRQGSPAHKQLRDWQDIVRSHCEGNPDYLGVIGVIVGQCRSGLLEFSACAFHPSGDMLWPLSLLVHRQLVSVAAGRNRRPAH
jgi:hypothetical protein